MIVFNFVISHVPCLDELIVELLSPKGPPGAVGIQGHQGERGEQGTAGLPGDRGHPGPQGIEVHWLCLYLGY